MDFKKIALGFLILFFIGIFLLIWFATKSYWTFLILGLFVLFFVYIYILNKWEKSWIEKGIFYSRHARYFIPLSQKIKIKEVKEVKLNFQVLVDGEVITQQEMDEAKEKVEIKIKPTLDFKNKTFTMIVHGKRCVVNLSLNGFYFDKVFVMDKKMLKKLKNVKVSYKIDGFIVTGSKP